MKASIIFNPEAGSKLMKRQIDNAVTYLKDKGWQIFWCQTAYPNHAKKFAHEAAVRRDDVAIAAGGDGTINEVVNGLVGTDTALGILPLGTANVFAADMHIPIPGLLSSNSILKAAFCLAEGLKKRIDVAKATFEDNRQRYFLLWAGIGFDSAVIHAYNADRRHYPGIKYLGMAAWLKAILSVLLSFKGSNIRITLDQYVIHSRTIMILINNTQLYARLWKLSPTAKLDDGLLDIVVLKGSHAQSILKHMFLITLRQHLKSPDIHLYRTQKVYIETTKPIPVHLDAELSGLTPVKVEIVPQTLNVIVPQNAPRDHFIHPVSPISG